jgi:hypothetical protein
MNLEETVVQKIKMRGSDAARAHAKKKPYDGLFGNISRACHERDLAKKRLLCVR